MKNKPIIIIAGEPYSVFLEIFFKTLKSKEIKLIKSPIIIIASKENLIKQMKKLSYEKWESKFYDVPFIKPNFDLLESMGVDTYMVNCSQETSDGRTKFVRVFHYGGWYEILENGNHYLCLGNEDWMSKEEEVIKTIKKELFEWAIDMGVIDIEEVDKKELTSFGE